MAAEDKNTLEVHYSLGTLDGLRQAFVYFLICPQSGLRSKIFLSTSAFPFLPS